MLKVVGKYGNVHINEKNIDIDNLEISELNKYLKELEEKEQALIKLQNEYLLQIIDVEDSKDE